MNNIIVNCIGGLGNQMTQYAFYKELMYRGYDVKLYIGDFATYNLHQYELSRIFNVNINYATKNEVSKYFSILAKIIRKLGLSNGGLMLQKHFEYYLPYLSPAHGSYLIGYWQSEKYFANVVDGLRKDFIFAELVGSNKLLANEINVTTSVSLHVRRGDYVGHELYEGICNLDYYKKAIEYIQQHVENPKFFIFSNDIEWCKDNMNIHDAVYVTGNTGVNNYQDMQLMSLCKYNILANSSFSWWSAWLNNNPDKLVIVPQKFFNGGTYNETDLYPVSWIKI